MQDVQPDQRWGVSAAAAGGTTALKNGWLATVTNHGLWTVNSIGRIRSAAGHTLLMAVLTQGSPSLQTGIITVERLARLTATAIR
jgi:hypothetical protein